jgi:hypothetical protein
MTRETGVQSMGNKTCPQCYDLAGIENEISDGHCTAGERLNDINRLVGEIAEKHGDVSEWAGLVEMATNDTPRGRGNA